MSRDRQSAPARRPGGTSVRPGRQTDNAVLALQQVVGNRAVGQALARKPAPPSQTPTITIGASSIQVTDGNITEWASGEVPDTLDVTSKKGKHSSELEKLSKERTRIKSLKLTTAPANKTGQHLDMGPLVIEIKNARIKKYEREGDTETWQVADFDGVHRTKTSLKVGQ